MCGEASAGLAAARAITCGWCEGARRGRYGARRVSMGGGEGRWEAETTAPATAETSTESGSQAALDADAGETEAEVEGVVSIGTGGGFA